MRSSNQNSCADTLLAPLPQFGEGVFSSASKNKSLWQSLLKRSATFRSQPLQALFKRDFRANALFELFEGLAPGKGSNTWGLSPEDWIIRANVALGLYIPQGYLAIRDKKHPWETWGRNLVSLVTTMGFTVLTKSSIIGINPVLNHFMQPKLDTPPAWPTRFQWMDNFQAAWAQARRKVLNPLALPGNYFELLKKTGVSFDAKDQAKAFWADLDLNQLHQVSYDILDNLEQKIAKTLSPQNQAWVTEARNNLRFNPWHKLFNWPARLRLNQLRAQALKTVATVEEAQLARLAQSFLNRVTAFKLLAVLFFMAVKYFVLDQMVMEVVFRFFAPLDGEVDSRRFEGKTLFRPKGKALNEPVSESVLPPAQPTELPPVAAAPLGISVFKPVTYQQLRQPFA